jgi:hypothetical protein
VVRNGGWRLRPWTTPSPIASSTRALAVPATDNAQLAPERAAGIGLRKRPAMLPVCGVRRSAVAELTMGRVERGGGPLRMVEGARASARSTHRAGRTARARLQQILATSGKLERPANDSGGVICSAQPVQGGYESIRRGTAYRGAGNARSCRWYTSCTSENGLWSRVYRTA